MISVASYNIQKSIGTDFRRRPERILSVLQELDADVVALQEVDRRFGARVSSLSAATLENETDYRPVRFGVRPGSMGWHGNVILIRKNVEVLAQRTITLPALEPRGAVLADLKVGPERLRVVGMHLGLVGLWRKRQAQAVLSALGDLEETLPTVMMGDLNEWSVNGGCLKSFALEHHVGQPGPSFPSVRPVFGFDRIITSPELSIVESGVHGSQRARTASDHLPVWARLSRSVEAGAEAAE
ncbi:endonuclease/exonuclease/phosphatase family protein [Paradevosia shaoguanensis]|uniref:Endonuclease/exonuclease/phosphatase family protein n=1 Tax=Paradevosia shaoguanensis TaxID=1335043 RepID=A0AA41UBU9_9HYPH|nr:endonuclease/exonuclease/phosphatase family protein [Paradevosia shaoguanensis]KFL27376.1 endonuclease [Devosia sp. 17-2-E-8]MCF1743420.1 endonuclease/exonuclease/phosphatase family protein [Paradevosia shaoguanensis]MCI0127903.1 endonuclease/exonuclease/phosphatase family protein [Paradevosia shaoguanensis]QMV01258.1 endonuclease [Devosia sp. D6-9]